MIKSLLILSLLVWPFGQLLGFSLPGIPFTVYLLDLITALLFASLIISSHRKKIFNAPLQKPLFVFWAVIILSLIFNINNLICSGPLTTFFYALRLFIYPSVYFSARYVGFSKIKKYIHLSIFIFSVLGLAQYIFLPDMRLLKFIGFDDHYYRLIGSFYDPNFTGAVFSSLALYSVARKKYLHSLLFIILLALTFSRASYLAFAICLVYLLVRQKKYIILVLLPLLGVVVYFLPKPFGEGVNLARTFSIFSRFESWRQGIVLFLQKPLLGWGYNTLRSPDGSRFQIDNSFIFLLATTGLAGLAGFLRLLLKGINSIPLSGQVVLLSLSIHAFFNNSLFYIWLSFIIWLVLASGSQKTTEQKTI